MKNDNIEQSWRNEAIHYKKALNNPWYKNIAILEDVIIKSTYSFFSDREFVTVCPPITTPSISSPMGLGSDSKPVKIVLDNSDIYLADSMQFYLEYYLRLTGKNVHYIMPSFRGEVSDARHLAQFYHSEAEIFGSLKDVINLVNNYVSELCKDILKKAENSVVELVGDTKHIESLINRKNLFPQISFEDACKLLKNVDGAIISHEGYRTISSLGEKYLLEYFDGIVWLKNYDYLSVPFYQAKDEKYAKNADLLFGIGEVVGCGERCFSRQDLLKSLEVHGVDPEPYNWYLYMKENSLVQTSGFGMGIERFLLFILNHTDIRDIPVIPRFNGIQNS